MGYNNNHAEYFVDTIIISIVYCRLLQFSYRKLVKRKIGHCSK